MEKLSTLWSIIIQVGILAFILIEITKAKNTGLETKKIVGLDGSISHLTDVGCWSIYAKRSGRAVERRTAADCTRLEHRSATYWLVLGDRYITIFPQHVVNNCPRNNGDVN